MHCLRCVIKRTRSHPSDRDLTVEMRRGSFNHDRYNPLNLKNRVEFSPTREKLK